MKKSNTRLGFKYRSGESNTLERDLKALRNSTFFAASRLTLNDPFEGRFDRNSIDNQFILFQKLLSSVMPAASASLDGVTQAANELLSFVDKSGIFSLSLNPLNELIWSHYCGSHQGFCVGYDLQKLVEFEPNLHYCIGVEYSDNAPALKHNHLIGPQHQLLHFRRFLGLSQHPGGMSRR